MVQLVCCNQKMNINWIRIIYECLVCGLEIHINKVKAGALPEGVEVLDGKEAYEQH